MLVKIKRNNQTSATIDCTLFWEKRDLVSVAENVNAIHDNDDYTCFSLKLEVV
tara:strand:+ start:309 stop:467 length:159 start_codon:yes stop_codon:yes gene_type:complete